MSNKLLLLDSNSLINRAFFALPPLQNTNGLYTNGIYGYLNMLCKLLHEERPTHVCAVFDCHAKTFRHLKYDGYKATRKGMPDELAMQVPVLQELLRKMGICVLYKEGWEADDIIGTLASRSVFPTIIVTGDKDSLQLVSEKNTVFLTKRGITEVVKYTPERLLQDGFHPYQIIEYKGLAGDSSDNIPGCPGVGEKTAKGLLAQYDTINGIFENIDDIKGKLKDKLVANKELIYLSKDLATISLDAEVNPLDSELVYSYKLSEEAKNQIKYLQFKNLIERFDFSTEKASDDIPDDSQEISESQENNENEVSAESLLLKKLLFIRKDIAEEKELIEFIEEIKEGASVYIEWKDDCVIIAHGNVEARVVFYKGFIGDGISESEAINTVKTLYSTKYNKVFYDAKKQMHILANIGIKIDMPYDDVLLMAYLINNTKVIKSQAQLLSDYFYDEDNSIAIATLDLCNELRKKIIESELTDLYRNIELPLEECLFDMENSGFLIDKNVLESLNRRYTSDIETLLTQIYDIAGESFNVNSTKQLAQILFEKLGLKHGKKNKTGFSVNAESLEELEHPIIGLILKYRELSKLKSTYIDGMKSVMNPASGKVHTSFNQCLTATGRLSSTEPNLQNIPVRREEGREIRKMFVPAPGNRLISADYSQIELRLLAHFSEEPNLINAYKNGIDIHTLTAAKMFGLNVEDVDKALRSSAKAINFGIIYGISTFGLARNTGVTNAQAKRFIEQYFETYPKVKAYMTGNVQKAKEQGYLRTLCGRIRYFPELKSPKYLIRAFGERAAMNMPLQGTASDIIKIAMNNVYRELKNNGLKAKLILQVHDELIVEAPEAECDKVKDILKREMENAVSLKVPLVVNVADGENWYEAK